MMCVGVADVVRSLGSAGAASAAAAATAGSPMATLISGGRSAASKSGRFAVDEVMDRCGLDVWLPAASGSPSARRGGSARGVHASTGTGVPSGERRGLELSWAAMPLPRGPCASLGRCRLPRPSFTPDPSSTVLRRVRPADQAPRPLQPADKRSLLARACTSRALAAGARRGGLRECNVALDAGASGSEAPGERASRSTAMASLAPASEATSRGERRSSGAMAPSTRCQR